MLEAFGKNADDAERPPRKSHRTADDVGIAVETPHPQRVAENHDVVIALNLVRLASNSRPIAVESRAA